MVREAVIDEKVSHIETLVKSYQRECVSMR